MTDHRVTRRAVLGAVAIVAAGAFAEDGAEPSTYGPGDDGPASARPRPRRTLPDRAAAQEPAPAAPSRPSREDIANRYDPTRPAAWGLAVPGVVTTLGVAAVRARAIALTFDACGGARTGSPGNGVDEALLATLRRYDVKATLFLNSRWVAANPKAFEALASDGRFEIANHGTRHQPLSVNGRRAYDEMGTRDPGEVYDEVAGNHDALTRLLGHPPRWFRPGTAYCDDVAVRIAEDIGERVVGFSVNGDGGATYATDQGRREIARAGAGDIVISHMNRPTRHTAAAYAVAIPDLLRRGLRPVTLSAYLALPAA